MIIKSFLGMNVTAGSVKHWLNFTSYEDTISNSSNVGTSSNNATITTNETDQGSPNLQLWDLRWFAFLSGPLLFGTILLPLITGPTIRYLCQSYVRLRVYWRLGFVVLVLISWWLTYALQSYDPGVGVAGLKVACDGILSITGFYEMFIVWRVDRHLGIWLFLASLVWSASSLANDVLLFAGDEKKLFRFVSAVAFVVDGMLCIRRLGCWGPGRNRMIFHTHSINKVWWNCCSM